MTQSMEEVINPGDVVLTFKNFHRVSYKKGDILAFQQGGNRTTFIKRVYAVAGDTLKLLRNHISINGQEIPHDPVFEMMIEESDYPDSAGYFSAIKYSKYLLRKSIKPSQESQNIIENGNAITVPEDHYFMVGDNYYESMDSRFWGFIPKKNIKGKIIWIF